jgi:hypothetical protein
MLGGVRGVLRSIMGGAVYSIMTWLFSFNLPFFQVLHLHEIEVVTIKSDSLVNLELSQF